ncbi:unnamed protein product [Amoebophrya sp. A25]|nr:unnamed protein product [Amoebophrya sp. A25]|eukprot:GSA25T00025703001.1
MRALKTVDRPQLDSTYHGADGNSMTKKEWVHVGRGQLVSKDGIFSSLYLADMTSDPMDPIYEADEEYQFLFPNFRGWVFLFLLMISMPGSRCIRMKKRRKASED